MTWIADTKGQLDPLQLMLEAHHRRSLLHSHKCRECGLERCCATPACEFWPSDINARGQRWICVFCMPSQEDVAIL